MRIAGSQQPIKQYIHLCMQQNNPVPAGSCCPSCLNPRIRILHELPRLTRKLHIRLRFQLSQRHIRIRNNILRIAIGCFNSPLHLLRCQLRGEIQVG